MDQGQCFRHELKYEIGYPRYLELRSRLQAVMCSDSHAGADGRYLIRSIYFDNYADKALREKRDGVSRREKFRIRYYNDDFSLITLEKKVKDNNLCRKLGAEITEAECRQLLDGRLNWMRGHPAVLVQELYAKMHYQILRPRVLVSYIREPYVYRAGNVRVTFDSDIRTTLYHGSFLEETVRDLSTADRPGTRILEIKYDAFLPEVIRGLIQTESLRQQAFSKYEACRRFGKRRFPVMRYGHGIRSVQAVHAGTYPHGSRRNQERADAVVIERISPRNPGRQKQGPASAAESGKGIPGRKWRTGKNDIQRHIQIQFSGERNGIFSNRHIDRHSICTDYRTVHFYGL